MQNPFSLSFGKEPASFIERPLQTNEITEAFTSEAPPYQVCMITGLRGSGKTVCLTTVSNELRRLPDWIVIDLNPERNMLHMLAAALSSRPELHQIFKEAKLDLSLFGIGFEIDQEPPVTDVVVALDSMLDRLTKKNKKILITVDEAVSNQNIREFASQFQIFMRNNYHVFMLMTGLYQNIHELQNEKTLTFLYRAPKVELKPLNIGLISEQYQRIFSLDKKEALDMAMVTKGYPYAFQVLGYLCYKENKGYKDVLSTFDAYLEDYVYDKIWSELSALDKQVIAAVCKAQGTHVRDIRQVCGFDSSLFSVYRKRLLKKGLITASEYGHLEMTLPRFEVFVENDPAAGLKF